MNISGPNRRQGTQAENTESASSSSVTNPPLQRGEGRRLRRQDALPTDIRYNANQNRKTRARQEDMNQGPAHPARMILRRLKVQCLRRPPFYNFASPAGGTILSWKIFIQ
ncbi:hypothetical protein SAMN05444507_101493 [Pseudomonas syringae]|nr:hypothetical protein SAMN05444507_101493 [Pseudomonas syringae]